MIKVVQILKAFNNAVDLTFTPVSVATNAGVTTVFMRNLYYLQRGLVVQIVTGSGMQNYTVESVDYSNNSFTVNDTFIVATSVTYPALNFVHGVPIMFNKEQAQQYIKSNVFPCIWFREIVNIDFGNHMQADARLTARLYFLAVANYKEWTTQQHYENVIDPLGEFVADVWMKQARFDSIGLRRFTDDSSFSISNRPNYGLFSSNKGHIANILNEHLSGVEVIWDVGVKNCI